MSPSRLFAAALTGLLLTIATTACRKSASRTATGSTTANTLIPGMLINSSGSWTATTSQGSTTLNIAARGSTVIWSVISEVKVGKFGSGGGSSSSGISLSSPADPWFVFVESSSRLWFFNGKDELTYSLRDPNGGGEGGNSIYSGKIMSGSPPIPPDLVPHLPPDLQELFPDIKPDTKRPSL